MANWREMKASILADLFRQYGTGRVVADGPAILTVMVTCSYQEYRDSLAALIRLHNGVMVKWERQGRPNENAAYTYTVCFFASADIAETVMAALRHNLP